MNMVYHCVSAGILGDLHTEVAYTQEEIHIEAQISFCSSEKHLLTGG